MKKQINYKVTGEEWKEAKDKAFAKIVKKVNKKVLISSWKLYYNLKKKAMA